MMTIARTDKALLIAVTLLACASRHGLAQTVHQGDKGAMLVEWDLVGGLSSMAILDDGGVAFAGSLAVPVSGGFAPTPALWLISPTGGLSDFQPTTLSGGNPSGLGVVSGLSRNGLYAIGTTLRSTGSSATVWSTSQIALPAEVGALQGSAARTGAAIGDNGIAFGTASDALGGVAGFWHMSGSPPLFTPGVSDAGAYTGILPSKTSADGTTVVGNTRFQSFAPPRLFTRAAVWDASQNFAEVLFADDYFSSAYGISPNGRYVSGFRGDLVEGIEKARGFIRDRTASQTIYLTDAQGNDWPAPVVDVTDDGKIAVGSIDILGQTAEPTDHGAFVAIDGRAQSLDAWLAGSFGLTGFNLDAAPAVYMTADTYHFAAYSTAAEKAYYISVPVASIQAGDINGDFDNDNDVDAADFLAWQCGGSPNPLSATDLMVWKDNFGSNAMSNASAALNLPEPETAGLALCYALMAAFRNQRRCLKRLGARWSPNC